MMDRKQICRAFMQEYKGHRNFFTPDIEEYLQSGRFLVEISSGRGIFSKWWIGVTILELQRNGDTERRDDLSTSFTGDVKQSVLEQAHKYVQGLKEMKHA